MTVEDEASTSGLGKGFDLKPQHVGIVIEAGAGDRETHAAQFGDDAFRTLEVLRSQAPADAPRLIDDGLEAHLHEFVGGQHARHAGADDGHLLAMAGGRDARQPRGVPDPVVEGEREIGAEDSDRALVRRFSHLGRVGSRHACTSMEPC